MMIEKENRIRSEPHLNYIRSLPCMIADTHGNNCNMKADAHHLLGAQEGAMGMTAGDNWAVPMCRKHHSELHDCKDGEAHYLLNWGITYETVLAYAQELYFGSVENSFLDNR